MKRDSLTELEKGFQTAFLDYTQNSNLAYRPQFLTNNYQTGQKLLSTLEEELRVCESFAISVAFITLSGITPLLQTLQELERKGVRGRILTTDYLNFSEPRALEVLNGLRNIDVRMYCTEEAVGFHTKGYIFQKDSFYRIIIGSSNMTQKALTINQEWNTKIVSAKQGEMALKITQEFEDLWSSAAAKPYDEFYDEYRIKYQVAKKQRKIAAQGKVASLEAYRLQPNRMQVEFIRNLEKLIETGADRGLLISATGTGKTYASAFGVRDVLLADTRKQRFLFLVHREQIAKQAMETFRKVFGREVRYGLLSGNSKDYDAPFLFSTMQMMSREDVLHRYDPREFSCIVLDEAHRTGAESYQKIMNYFTPSFWLGMTASPERTDEFDVFSLFDHNIACEIRLQQAMEEDLLCPFHYFGITELEIEGEVFDDEIGVRNFRYLVCDERVDYILKQAEYYGHSGERVKGLIFCSRRAEAEELSEQFNKRGYRTVFLGGDSAQEKREEMMDRLTSDTREDVLDYIFTVDIFNEGVDLPEVNQVIMLRPTQSPIVFVQQLGRGLRKATDKEYVVVLDFIGNYKNNFMIPIALSGDRSYNKDNVRRYVMEGTRVIPGSSTIHFDEISRKRIFAAIDTANFSDIRLIKENYKNLKYKLGRIPGLMDFDRYGEMDVLRIFDNSNLGSYYKFLVKYEKEYTVRLNKQEEKVIEFISKKLASGKRIHEIELLNRLLQYQKLQSVADISRQHSDSPLRRADGRQLRGQSLQSKSGESQQHGQSLLRQSGESQLHADSLQNQSEGHLIQEWKRVLREQYQLDPDAVAAGNVLNVLTNEFPAGSGKKTYADCVFVEAGKGGMDYVITDAFADMLGNPDFYKMVEELVAFARYRYERDYRDRYQGTDFVLYQKYTYEDACRLLGWEHNEVPLNIGGYKYDRKTKTFPVFINYDKADDIQDTVKYEDHFVAPDRLIAISKSNRTLKSEDVQNFLYAKERGISVELFVRKNKDDKISKEFYYLGHMTATGRTKEFIMPNTTSSAVEIEWALDTPVRGDLYEYIVSG